MTKFLITRRSLVQVLLPQPDKRKGIPFGIPFLFLHFCGKDLSQLPSVGRSPSGLISRSFSIPRIRWTMKRVAEKAKTRSIGHGCVRDDYVLRVQAAKPRELVQVHSEYLFFFLHFCGKDLSQLPPVGMSPSGLINRGEASLPPPVADEGSEDSA